MERDGNQILVDSGGLRAQRVKPTKVKGKHVDATLTKCMATFGLISRTRYLPVVHHET